jgi:ankyrin repeat protein
LRSLSFSTIDDRQHNIALPHQGTCDWLFETAQFQQWRDRNNLLSHNGVLWIKGKPGAGKSTLMKHTLFYCQKTFKDYIIAVYFFNARGNELEKTSLGMLRSLLYQLLDHNPLLCNRFIPMFLDKQKKHGNDWEWQLGELKSFLLSEIKKFQPKPLLLLIDALDECNEVEVREVVSFLESISVNAVGAKTPLNICLSSRHYPNISMEKRLELTVEWEKGHNRDIALYVQYKLRIRDKEIEEELLQKAANIFMWVVLVVEMVNQAYDHGQTRAMRNKLREVPSDLDEVFWILLGKDYPDKQETILMLQWVLFAERLLKPEELYFAVLAGIETEELNTWNRSRDTSETIKRFITSTSKGLIEVRKTSTPKGLIKIGEGDIEIVQFIHESVKDFLLRNKRLQMLDPKLELHAIGASHNRLVACCMSYIMMKELEPLVKGMFYTKRKLAFDYPFLEYASTYVLYHAEKAQASCITQQALVQQLQQPHKEFERLRSFHDVFEEKSRLRYDKGLLLYVVSLHSYYELVKIALLEVGANLNAQGGYYGNALQAASARASEAVVTLLVEKGADVNAQGGCFGSALQAASARAHEAIVALLLEKGADVNAQGGCYRSALQAASESGYKAVVELLLEKGADVNVQGGHYGSALQAASSKADEVIVALLVEKGADINVQGRHYGSALYAASRRGHEAIVTLLLDKGADVNAQGGYYGNALQAASAHGHEAVVALLVENGADVNAQGGEYGSALQAASADGHEAVVVLLLDKGADVNVQGGHYGTALQAASYRGHEAVVALLLEKGAGNVEQYI